MAGFIFMMTVTGKIEKREVGIGAWALVSDEGKTYELKNPPQSLCKPEQRVEVKGNIRDDVMTLAMIGEVLEVDSFKFL